MMKGRPGADRARISLSCGNDSREAGRLEKSLSIICNWSPKPMSGMILTEYQHLLCGLRSVSPQRSLPKKWGVVPRLRSGSEDRERLNQIVELSRGPKYAPRALMVLAEIALKDSKDDDAVIALEKLVNFYPEHYLAEKAYFMLGNIHKDFVSGPSYDQGATLHALNYYEDYLILFDELPSKGTDETPEEYSIRKEETLKRKKLVQEGRNQMRESLAQSKLRGRADLLKIMENIFLVRWQELGNQPALQFYNEAITTAPESMPRPGKPKSGLQICAMSRSK